MYIYIQQQQQLEMKNELTADFLFDEWLAALSGT